MFKTDARRYRRIGLNLPARVTINASDERDGRLLNISPGDMALICDASPAPGDAAIVTIEGLDIIEGTVARIFPDGFAMSFLLSRRRRSILIEQLMLCANPDFAAGLGDRRRSPRHPGKDARSICRLENGASLMVKIVDTSVNGVSVDASRRPPVGASIHIGRKRGVVLRHTSRGFVVVYDDAAALAAGKGGTGKATALRAV